MNKRDSIDKAKSLMSQNSYSEAAKIFNEVQEAFADEINGWDVFFMIKCVRAGGEVRNIDELAEKHKDFDNARSLYVWLLYDRHVKIFLMTFYHVNLIFYSILQMIFRLNFL